MLKRVYLNPYANVNFGDDLFIKILLDRYPDTMFYLYAPVIYKRIFSKYKNITVFNSSSLFIGRLNKIFLKLNKEYLLEKFLINRCDCILRIGGSIYMERYMGTDFKLTKEHYFSIGSNFGPYFSNEFYENYKALFSSYDDICFRDQRSYELFKDLKNARCATDIAFLLNTFENTSSENYIVISVKYFAAHKELIDYHEDYIKKIIQICHHFMQKGINVKLVSFCKNEGDEDAAELIYSQIDSDKKQLIRKIYYTGDIDYIINIFSKASFVIATRYHSMVLGWILKKQVFPIIYNEKMKNTIDDVGFSGIYTYAEKIKDLDMEDISRSFSRNDFINIEYQKKLAELQFRELDKFLGTSPD